MAVVEVPLQTPNTTADIGQGQPDPQALAVAQEIQSWLPKAKVILFGSRATDTWSPRSDIDLALIGISPDTDAMLALKDQARGVVKTEYTDQPPHIQITSITRTDFEAHRTSFPRIAGQVQFRELTPTGERLPAMPQDDPWPGVQGKLQAVQSHLMRSLRALGAGDPADALFHVQEALEICLKAALGANRLPFDKHHDLEGFAADLSEVRSKWMEGMLPPAQLLELSKFREQAIYGGRSKKWPSNDPEEIVEAVQRICGELAGHILKHLGKSPRDVKYEHWLSNGPLGGMEATPIPAHLSSEDWQKIGGLKALILTNTLSQNGLNRLKTTGFGTALRGMPSRGSEVFSTTQTHGQGCCRKNLTTIASRSGRPHRTSHNLPPVPRRDKSTGTGTLCDRRAVHP
ncbi:MAG: HEPN domain-containing protein [Caldilineaceae bacterium]|nr:HEPN domain-containing protein [Caldilineaceae bacterium]